jgi:hypothetical protein
MDLLGSKKVLLEKGLQQNPAHLSRAQYGYADMGQLRRDFSDLNGYLRHRFLPCLTD